MIRVPDVFVRRVSEPLWDRYEGSVRLATMRRLDREQWDSPEVIRERQNALLRRIVTHAATTSPFYRERFGKAGIDPTRVSRIGDLAALPVLTKDEVREHRVAMCSDVVPAARLVESKTGGSTGVSLRVLCDRRGVEMRAGAALLADEWSGWRLGQPVGAVWGNPPVPRTLKSRLRRLFKDRFIYLDTMSVDDKAIDRFLVDWSRMRPGLLYGHAHSIFILCENLAARGIGLSPSGVVATSMMLIEQERQVIEAVCGVPVTNRYGCEEVSLIACECEQHRGLHLNAFHNVVEFLRDDGTPCDSGEDGRIVVTELVNTGMPMIRYEVGDRGVPSDRACSCGRGLPMMEQVTGRVADFLRSTDGRRIAGISIIENTLTRLPGLRQMQVVQDELDHLTVNLVPGDGYGPGVAGELTAILRGYLGAAVAVEIREVDGIPREPSGKYRFTICRVGDGTGGRG